MLSGLTENRFPLCIYIDHKTLYLVFTYEAYSHILCPAKVHTRMIRVIISGCAKRESGENPELTRNGIGERKRQTARSGIWAKHELHREAVAVGADQISNAPESEHLPGWLSALL